MRSDFPGDRDFVDAGLNVQNTATYAVLEVFWTAVHRIALPIGQSLKLASEAAGTEPIDRELVLLRFAIGHPLY